MIVSILVVSVSLTLFSLVVLVIIKIIKVQVPHCAKMMRVLVIGGISCTLLVILEEEIGMIDNLA